MNEKNTNIHDMDLEQENICCCKHNHNHNHENENKFYVRVDDTEDCDDNCDDDCHECCEEGSCGKIMLFIKLIVFPLILFLVVKLPLNTILLFYFFLSIISMCLNILARRC